MQKPKHEKLREAYRLWYEYLRLHECYERVCKGKGHRTGDLGRLYKDFGNVHRYSFEVWWESHTWLFEELPPYTVERINNDKEYKDYRDATDTLLIRVNLWAPKREIQKGFNALVREHHPGRPGRPNWDNSMAEYPLCNRPNLRYLRKVIEVYKRRKSGDRPLWKIGIDLKLSPEHTSDGPQDMNKVYKDRVMTAIVSRYIRQAKILIHNVGKGRFPDNVVRSGGKKKKERTTRYW